MGKGRTLWLAMDTQPSLDGSRPPHNSTAFVFLHLSPLTPHPPLHDHFAVLATAVPALWLAVPRRASSQPGRAYGHLGDGHPLPCAMLMSGVAWGLRRAIGAVPAGARPMPRRRGELPR